MSFIAHGRAAADQPQAAARAEIQSSQSRLDKGDALNNVQTVKTCLAKAKAGRYFFTSSEGFKFAKAGPILCTAGRQILGDHRKFVLFGIPARDHSGKNWISRGDYVFQTSITVVDRDNDAIVTQLGGHTYYADTQNGRFVTAGDQGEQEADIVREGPPLGVAGSMQPARLADLPDETRQSLTRLATSAEAVRGFVFPAGQ